MPASVEWKALANLYAQTHTHIYTHACTYMHTHTQPEYYNEVKLARWLN